MSYENPQQFVDKQSGQYFRDMQKSITQATTSTISSFVESYKENAKAVQKMNLEADKIVTDAKNAIFQTQSKNSTIQFQNIDEKLKKLGELKKMDPTKLTHKQRNFITSMTSLGSRMFNSLENTTASAIAFKDQSGIKLGSQGSNDQYRNKAQFETMSIMNGTLPGSKEAFYDEDENGNVVYSVSVKNAKGVEVGKILNKDLETTMFVDKVPNLQPDINKAIQKAKAILNIESEFSEAYSKMKGDDVIGVNNKGVGITAKVWEPALKAQTDLIALGLENNEKSSFHNNITRTKSIQVTESNIEKLNKEVEKRNQSKADGEDPEKLYKKGDIIKDTQNNLWEYDIVDFGSEKNSKFAKELFKYANGDIEAIKARNKKIKKDKPSTVTNKLTYAQLLEKGRVEDREKVFSEYVGKGTEGDRYTIPAKNNSGIQAIKREEIDEDGKIVKTAWYLQQKRGGSFKDISQGYSDVKFIAEDLGYTIPESKNDNDSADEGKIELEFVNGELETVAQARARLVAQGLANLEKNATKKD